MPHALTSRFLIGFALSLLSLPIRAFDFSGRVREADSGGPVADATVVIIELDRVQTTNERGEFLFTGLERESFSVGVYAEGFEEKVIKTGRRSSPLTISVEKLLFQMDVEVQEQRSAPTGSETISRDEIKSTPKGGDAFEVINRAPGVTKMESGTLGRDITMAKRSIEATLDFPLFSLLNTTSYRSLPYFCNVNSLDAYIPLSFIYYPLPNDALSISVLPPGVLDGMELQLAGDRPALGPGSGLLTVARPANGIPKAPELSVATSMIAASFAARVPLGPSSYLVGSIRKSLVEFTLIPLAALISRSIYNTDFPPMLDVAEEAKILYGFGDLYLRYGNEVSTRLSFEVDLFSAAGYESWVDEGVGTDYYGATARAYLRTDDLQLNQQTGGGLRVVAKPGENLRLLVGLSDVFFSANIHDLLRYESGEGAETTQQFPLNTLSLRGELSDRLSDRVTVTGGLAGRYLYGNFSHAQSSAEILKYYYPVVETKGSGFSNFEVDGFLEPSILFGNLKIEPSVRLDYFSFTGTLHASPFLKLAWAPSKHHSLELTGGMRVDRIEYISNLLFKSEAEAKKEIAEDAAENTGYPSPGDYADYGAPSEDYLIDSPAVLYSAESRYIYSANELEVSGDLYGLLLDNLSGFNFQTQQIMSYGNMILSGQQNQLDFQNCDRMFSLGGYLQLKRRSKGFDFTGNYQVALSRYRDKASGDWVIPNSDITNMVKTYFHIAMLDHLGIDLNINAAIGVPDTPSRRLSYGSSVSSSDIADLPYEPILDQYNTLRDWMPRFTVNFMTDWKWKWGKRSKADARVFLDLVNVFSFPRYVGPKSSEPGFEEKSWRDRSYNWVPIDPRSITNMKLDAGIEVSW